MPTALVVLAVLVGLVTVVHYEALRGLDVQLARIAVPPRSKLLVAVVVTLLVHTLEVALYASGMWALAALGNEGTLEPMHRNAWRDFLYFSLETYSSLGFGDVTPRGPLCIVAGLEALHGLLLIGWSASFLHLAMERYWGPARQAAQRTGTFH